MKYQLMVLQERESNFFQYFNCGVSRISCRRVLNSPRAKHT